MFVIERNQINARRKVSRKKGNHIDQVFVAVNPDMFSFASYIDLSWVFHACNHPFDVMVTSLQTPSERPYRCADGQPCLTPLLGQHPRQFVSASPSEQNSNITRSDNSCLEEYFSVSTRECPFHIVKRVKLTILCMFSDITRAFIV